MNTEKADMRDNPLLDLVRPYPALLAVYRRIQLADKTPASSLAGSPDLKGSGGLHSSPSQGGYFREGSGDAPRSPSRSFQLAQQLSAQRVEFPTSNHKASPGRCPKHPAPHDATVGTCILCNELLSPAKETTTNTSSGCGWQTPRSAVGAGGSMCRDMLDQRREEPPGRQEHLEDSKGKAVGRRLPPPPCWGYRSTEWSNFFQNCGRTEVRSRSLFTRDLYDDRSMRSWPTPHLVVTGDKAELLGSLLGTADDATTIARSYRHLQEEARSSSLPPRPDRLKTCSLQASEPYSDVGVSAHFHSVVARRGSDSPRNRSRGAEIRQRSLQRHIPISHPSQLRSPRLSSPFRTGGSFEFT